MKVLKLFGASVLLLLLLPNISSAREPPVQLSQYVAESSAIILCTVEQDNGDGSVTVRVNKVLKGDALDTVVVSGETGFCIRRGPASKFMESGKNYLVFLFEGNKVGRLGGILEIRDQNMLYIRFMAGFEGTAIDRAADSFVLPVIEAERQIKDLL